MRKENFDKTTSKNRLFIIAGIVTLVIVGILFYFLYWVKTPAYSLNLIREAVEKHDLVKFEKHVDTESLYNRAFDEVVQKSLSESGYANNQLAMGIVGMMKKTVIDELVGQTKKYVETGDFEATNPNNAAKKTNQPDGKEMASNINKNAGISYIQFKGIEDTNKDGKIAVVSVKIFDKKIEKDFIVKLKMRELDNGEWCLVEVANLTDYLTEREKAVKEKLNALNKPIREQIEKAFQVVSLDINARNENSFFPMYRLHYTLKFKLPDNSKKVAQLKGLFVISDKDGKDLYGTRVDNLPDISSIYTKEGYAPDKVYTWRCSAGDTLNPFIPNEEKIAKQGVDSFAKKFEVLGIKFEDGTVAEILTDLPEPKSK